MHNPKGSFRKVLAAGLAISTAMWAMSGIFAVSVAVAAAVEVHPAGSLVLSGGTVWKIADDGGSRQGFDTPERFWSSRYTFDQVVPANSADLALSDSGLAPWGSGVLFNDNGTIFMVSGGAKRGFSSAAAFTGQGFSFGDAVAGDVSSLSEGAAISSASQSHPEGTFVLDGGTVWYISATGRMGLSQPGVLFSEGAGFDDLVPANAADLALADEGLMNFRTGTLVNDSGTIWAVEGNTKRGFPSASCFTGFGFSFSDPIAGDVSTYSQGADFCPAGTDDTTPPPVSSTGTLTVSLAGDTPAATTLVANAARAGFTKVNFTASGGDVVIDSMQVERIGVSEDSNFSELILLDVSGGTSVAAATQLGNEKTLGSTHQATFNEDISVSNGTTKSILIAANMAATLQASDQAAIQLNSVAVSGDASVVGSLPFAGNSMTMNNSVTISTATVAAGGQNPSATTQNIGTNDYVMSSIKLTNGSQEKIELHSIKFTQNGSAGDTDVANLELVVDGSVIASVTQPDNKEVVFNFSSSPVVLNKGNNKEFALRGDIVDGSNRTVSFDIEDKADLVVKGQTFGFFIAPTYPNSTSPRFNANDTTIDKGTISFSKGVISTLNIAEGATGQVLGAFKSTVQGEAVRVTQFVMGVTVGGTGNTGDVTNLVIKDPDGIVVGGPVDPDTTVTSRDTATSTDTIVFPVGTTTYTIEGDLNSDFAANDTVKLDLPDPDGLTTAKGEVTNDSITANPTTDLSLDTVTVKTAALSVSTSASPAAQSVIVGQTGFTFANIVLDASDSGEDVRVNQVAVVQRTATGREDGVANLQLFDGDTALFPIKQPANVASGNSTTTFSLTSPIVIAKGGSTTLTVKGDLVSGSANDTHQFGCEGTGCVTATGVDTANSVTASVTSSTGQLMTIAGSGTLTLAGDASTPQQDFLAVGGASKLTVGELLLTAVNEDIDMTKLHFVANAVNGGALNDEFSKIYLFDGATQVASVTPTSSAAVTFQNLDGKLVVPKGSSGKKVTIKVDAFDVTNNQGDGNVGDSGDGVSLDVQDDAYSAKGVSSGAVIAATSQSGTFTGKQFTIFKSLPTYEKLALSDSTLTNGSGRPLFKFKITADSKGDVGFYKATFAVTTSTATVTAFELFEEPGTANEVNLTNNGSRSLSSVLTASSGGTGGEYSLDILFDTGTDGVASGGEFRFIPAGTSKTFELRGTVASSVSGSTVTVVQRGDDTRNTSAYPDQASDVDGDEDDQFIWSDLHYGNSSSTATVTDQWFNGFKIAGLSSTTTSQVVSR